MASRLQDVIQRGLAAARPLATTVAPGTLYFATDTSITTRSDGTTWQSYGPSSFSGGDVVGPSSAVNGNFALYNGITGKLIGDAGLGFTTTVGTPGVNTLVPSEKSVRDAIAAAIAAIPAPVSPAMVLLESHIAAASASLIFTTRNAPGQSGATFQSDYDNYLIQFVNLVPVTHDVGSLLVVSTNGGTTYDTGANYDNSQQYTAPSFGPTNGSSAGATQMLGFGNIANTATLGVAGFLHVYQPTSTVSFKRFIGMITFGHSTIGLIMWPTANQYRSATAVNAFKFQFNSGNISTGQIKVYGVK